MKRSIKILIALVILASVFTLIATGMTSCRVINSIDPNKHLNLDGYELVMCDDFDGDSLDLSIWEYRLSGARRSGYNHPDQISVKDGNLVLTAEYKNGEYGEGWYAGMIRLKEEYTYGYFEIRCIPNPKDCFWSAFWLQSKNAYIHEASCGGVYGAEIDIFETYKNHTFKTKNFITSSIHCNGSDDDVANIDSKRIVKTYVPRIRSEYHTFGLLWTESEYIFYVDGVETGRSSFASGVSTTPEEVIVSLEIPDEITWKKSQTTQFIVDYVKIYRQKP